MVSKTEKIKELKEILADKKSIEEIERMSIIYDTRQYSVRIPRKFAEAARLNPKKDVMEFTLTLSTDGLNDKHIELIARLVRNERK